MNTQRAVAFLRLVLTLSVVLLQACAAPPSNEAKTDPKLAYVLGLEEGDATQRTGWKEIWVVSVDGRAVDRALFASRTSKPVGVQPGTRQLLIGARFGFVISGESTQFSLIEVETVVESGRTYRLNGERQGYLFAAWLEDARTGERVSKSGHSTFHGPERVLVLPTR